MGTNIYKYTHKGKVELTNREVKKYIMQVENLTSDEYQKRYDIFKNKLRSFEEFERQQGKQVTPQSPQRLLYYQARSKATYGADYKPSLKYQRIESFSAYGQKSRAKSIEKQTTKISVKYNDYVQKQFSGLIKNNEIARKIFESNLTPIQKEQALSDFANKLHTKIDEQNKIIENQAIPFGETFGSDFEIDFDLSDYQ